MVLLSNIFAIFLQSLCINLGTVTGMNLAQMTRAHCPRWLNYLSYAFGESAIIATDMAEVIGTAIALSMLSDGRIPLVAGCAISIVDVLFILVFYRSNGASMNARRLFEFFVALLVLGVVICFCVQLTYIQNTSVGDVFHGYVPSSALIEGQGLYQACGILGATVMPHSLYLGSGLVQGRLRDFDRQHDLLSPEQQLQEDSDADSLKDELYRPSLQAITSCRWYSIAECAISLFTFALFVNSAILIVAGASLYDVAGAENASLFGIYDLLSRSLAPAAGKIFAVALLLSGTSAGIVCTIAGQMVSEGQLRLKMKPWKRRLLTRSVSIIPSIIVAGALGGPGVDKALVGSQVALSVILPFVSAPLVWFTMRGKYMTVTSEQVRMGQPQHARENEDGNEDGEAGPRSVNMRIHPVTAFFAVVIWGVIVIMNVALLVLLGLGKT
jgi:metal iron transporter